MTTPDSAAERFGTFPVPSMVNAGVRTCNDIFDGMYQDRRAGFACDLLEGHDGPHVEIGYGWTMTWGEGLGATDPRRRAEVTVRKGGR